MAILRHLILVVLLCVPLSPGQAEAAALLDSFVFTVEQVGEGTMPVTPEMLNCTENTSAGTATCMGVGMTIVPPNPAFMWELSNWQIQLDGDPLVSSNFAFQNVGGGPLTFIISASIGVAPLAGPTLMDGSTGGSVTDSNANGVGGLATATPDPFYTGLIDGLPAPGTALHGDPFFAPGPAFPGTFGAAGGTASIPPASFGQPVKIAGPAVAGTIGIRNKFQLDTLDSVASTNFFQVIPEPGTASLLGLGLAGLALLRRRST